MTTLKEEIKIKEVGIKEYLNNNGIDITENYFIYNKSIDKKEAISQVILMVNLHKILLGYRGNCLTRIGSSIGKEVESYKVQVKRLQKDYDKIIETGMKNNLDKLIISDGKRILQQATEVIDYIYNHNYFGIIERSMNREEICIGRADQGNLTNKPNIQIGSIKYVSYNLVEEDLYKYIKRLQRKNCKIDEEELIKTFIYESHLSNDSFFYLKGLNSYPKDSLRIWERYRANKKSKTEEEFLMQFKKSIEYESKKFI
ncbi:spore coat protein [Clostridium uliginosum]|uniref:spore coat protein n=1 Tax=Clostridium uliginosum TaxID=119641 RepID=UPI000B7EA016|nr:spore coat protein [Clostridium uliginosum]